MKKVILSAALSALACVVVDARARDERPLDVVPSLDLERYMGTWHEIARLPNRFQDHCTGTVTATYSLQPDGRVKVVNACRTRDGGTDRAEGVARRASAEGPSSKLKVRFAPASLSWLPFVWGDYQVIDLAADYSTAVVGTPDRKYLWFLARTPEVDPAVFNRMAAIATAQGFDVSRLLRPSGTK